MILSFCTIQKKGPPLASDSPWSLLTQTHKHSHTLTEWNHANTTMMLKNGNGEDFEQALEKGVQFTDWRKDLAVPVMKNPDLKT